MPKKFILCFLLLLCFLVTLCDIGGSEDITFLNSVRASPSEKKNYSEFYNEHGVITQFGIVYKTDIEGLIIRKENFDQTLNITNITIEWNKSEYCLQIDGFVNYIRIRPKHASFIYSREEEFEGGDFAQCSLHYVNVKCEKGEILVDEQTLSSSQVDTDLAWSSDGEYYLYSEYGSLHLKKFESGEEWVTKMIEIIKTEENSIKIVPDEPFVLMGFKWIDNDRKIYFCWKYYPYDEEVFYATIDIKQFFRSGINSIN